jgi:putative DNA primase/helicase
LSNIFPLRPESESELFLRMVWTAVCTGKIVVIKKPNGIPCRRLYPKMSYEDVTKQITSCPAGATAWFKDDTPLRNGAFDDEGRAIVEKWKAAKQPPPEPTPPSGGVTPPSEPEPDDAAAAPSAEEIDRVAGGTAEAKPEPEPWDKDEVEKLIRPQKAAAKPKRAPKVEPASAATPDADEDEIAGDDGDIDDDDASEGDGGEISIPAEKRPCFRVFDKWTYVLEHEKLGPGVYYFTSKAEKDEVICKLMRVCSPLHVDAIASDDQGNNYGRVLRFITSKKTWRTWAMPMELLAGSADVLREELFGMGVIIHPEARALLTKYLTEERPSRHVRCATQVGWCFNSFALPDVVIGPQAAGVIFQSGERVQAEYGLRGTLEGWQKQVSARAIGNPVLMMALSTAFVGPLLDKVGAESGGIHMVGHSSTGKSSVLKAAASVWGGPQHVRSWNSTANGMEGVAALFNDGLLPLDEISECAAKDIDRIIYAIANGVGRQRASRSGSARSVTRWRCFVLSSGERMVPTAMATAGIEAKAGQLVRLIDLPVLRQHGVWDDLQDLPSGGALSDAVKDGVAKHHGTAGREFLKRLTFDNRKWPEAYADLRDAEEFAVVDDGDGQAKRVAKRFVLIALAGEVATEYGVTGWSAGEATHAAAIMFQTWCAQRQHGNAELAQIVEQVAAFIDRHGGSRFSEIGTMDRATVVRDRAGWWEYDDDGDGKIYWFTRDGLREATKGHDFDNACDVLEVAGALLLSDKGERARQKKIDGDNARRYAIWSARIRA